MHIFLASGIQMVIHFFSLYAIERETIQKLNGKHTLVHVVSSYRSN